MSVSQTLGNTADLRNADARNALGRMRALWLSTGLPMSMRLKGEVQGAKGDQLRSRIDQISLKYTTVPKIDTWIQHLLEQRV